MLGTGRSHDRGDRVRQQLHGAPRPPPKRWPGSAACAVACEFGVGVASGERRVLWATSRGGESRTILPFNLPLYLSMSASVRIRTSHFGRNRAVRAGSPGLREIR